MLEAVERASVQEALNHTWLKTNAPSAGSPPREAMSPRPEHWTPGKEASPAPPSGGASEISEPISNVPTPLKPRSWDSSRNMAYSPPVGTPAEEHSAAKSSPARQHEQSPLVERRSKS